MLITLQSYGDKEYKIYNGTWYSVSTPDDIVYRLDSCMGTNARVRLFYGDARNGRSWEDEWSAVGTVGRSMGTVKIPLLIETRRSVGGGAILDNCIVKLMINGCVVYQHPAFYQPQYNIDATVKPVAVKADGQIAATFKTETSARRWVDFMTGRRMSK
jgi:hypothetical protein